MNITSIGVPILATGLFMLGMTTQLAVGASVTVQDLRCEYLQNPLGLDVVKPRLSWRLEARNRRARGQCQTAYHVQVSSGANTARAEQGDLWDSGEVASDQSLHIVYAGKPLRSGQACSWRVRVRDEAGEWSDWSKSSAWTMGLLRLEDWKARWIGIEETFVKQKGWPPPDNTIPDPWFRKTFTLPAAPERALIYVASVGYHEVYVNGSRVGDAVLAPSATDHKQRARYVTYDITRHLKKGQNALGLWLGLGWSIYPHYQTNDKPASPIVMAQAEIAMKNGSTATIVTDASWKTRPSNNTLLGVWDFMHFGGELQDMNRALPTWCDAEADMAPGWKPVKLYSPQLILSADKTEPNRLVKAIQPLAVREVTNGVYRIDMGVNFAGFFELTARGEPGDRIEMQFSEREKEPMTHRLRSVLILGPDGKGTFRNRFNYGVGRWVQITGLREKPSLGQIRGWLVRTDYARAGTFSCDHPMLNRIYETALWTFENLSLGSYVVDCPQRERMGYGGDAHATTRPALNNYDLGAFYTKWIEDWRDVQGPDGNLPYTSPTYWGGGGPGWSGYCITLPWELYRRYGDTRILEENLPMMQKWLAFLETKSADHLLRRWGGEWDFLGDWLWPGAKGVNGDTRETLFFNNCYWVYNLQTAARIAAVVGDDTASRSYAERAATVRAAVHKEYFNATDSSYVNGFPAYLAIALLTEIPPADLRPAVWKRLEQEILVNRKGHIHAGITGGAFLFHTLIESNRNDLVLPMVSQREYPGWGDMLNRGATTFYEDWECNLSYLHSSYLYVASWFNEALGGIRHPEAGFKRFVIEPWVSPKGPQRARATYVSPYGTIASGWEQTLEGLNLEVTVPPNTTALLKLHGVSADRLREGRQELGKVRGISARGGAAGWVELELQPGIYRFSMTR